MKIPRLLTRIVINRINDSDKVIVIYGARQTGKTTLAKEIISALPYRTLSINADQKKYLDVLASRDSAQMAALIGNNEFLFIDEAQRIPEAGINLKIIHDEFPHVKGDGHRFFFSRPRIQNFRTPYREENRFQSVSRLLSGIT